MRTNSYRRVIPRDLFNESKLLKCMGQLSLKIHDGMLPEGMDIEIEDSGQPFDIIQLSDGYLTINNYHTYLNNEQVIFKTTYNSKQPYPLFCQIGYNEYEVFDDNGEFTKEFKAIEI